MTTPITSPKNVLILLATHNGEPWLAELFESLKAQTHSDWQLLIRDDASADGTVRLCQEFARADARVRVLPGERVKPRGPMANFEALMKVAGLTADALVFFCDQDDLWHPKKVETFMRHRMALSGLPTLLASDLDLIGSQGEKLLPKTFWKIQNIPQDGPIEVMDLCSRNFFPGCSMCVDSDLLSKALPIPDGAIMHDWWLVLIAAAVGQIDRVRPPMTNYRQHHRNHTGATTLLQSIKSALGGSKQQDRADFLATFTQAQAVLSHLRPNLHNRDPDILLELRGYLSLLSDPSPLRLITAWGGPIRKNHKLAKLAFFLRLWRFRGGADTSTVQ